MIIFVNNKFICKSNRSTLNNNNDVDVIFYEIGEMAKHVITNELFDKQKASNIDNELVKVVPEPDSMNPLGAHGDVVHQLCEGLHQPLSVSLLSLSLYQSLHQLLIRVLKQTNEDVESGGTVRNKFTVYVLRQNQV